jgi:hypothetical protein
VPTWPARCAGGSSFGGRNDTVKVTIELPHGSGNNVLANLLGGAALRSGAWSHGF